jgi:hypothetical protein
MRHLLFPLVVLLTLPACPTIRLGELRIQSLQGSTLTLAATVTVEKAPPEGEGDPAATDDGRGLVAVYVPEGWRVSSVRTRMPDETPFRALAPSAQSAVSFQENFPAVPGHFWAFASPEQKIAVGTWTYPLEITVELPKKAKGGQVGVAVGVFADKLEGPPAPDEYALEIKGKKATLRRLLAGPPGTAPVAAEEPQGEKASTYE